MTVWAEHAKVLQAVVIVHAIAVIDLNCERASPPFSEAAFLARVLQQTGREQAALDRVAAPRVLQNAL
jgi:hypothetical protein